MTSRPGKLPHSLGQKYLQDHTPRVSTLYLPRDILSRGMACKLILFPVNLFLASAIRVSCCCNCFLGHKENTLTCGFPLEGEGRSDSAVSFQPWKERADLKLFP